MITYLGEQIVLSPLADPAAPTLTRRGTAGSTTYSYLVVGFRAPGHTAASEVASLSNGPATLTTLNNIDITPPYVPGVTRWDIYRTVGGATQGKIGQIAPLNFGVQQRAFVRDTGRVAVSGDPPDTNTTGQLTIGVLDAGGLVQANADKQLISLPGYPVTFTTLNDGAVYLESNIHAAVEYAFASEPVVHIYHGPLRYFLLNDNNVTSLDVSALVTLQALRVYSTSISVLDVSNLVDLRVLDMHNNVLTTRTLGSTLLTSINVSGNSLDAPAINAILAVLVDGGLENGTADLSGGDNAAPTGQGITDVATLEGRGWTVTTS